MKSQNNKPKQAVPTYSNRGTDKMNTKNDKVVVILGASSGIGESTVRLLADKGAKLVIASRREEKFRELAESLERCTITYEAAGGTGFQEDD